jgi:hypothetical protein
VELTAEQVRTFGGPRADYYLTRWNRLDGQASRALGFNSGAFLLLNVAVASFFGVFGTYLYFVHARRKVRQLASLGQVDPQTLGRAGGVRWLGVLLFLGVVLVILITALVWPEPGKVTFGPEEEIYYEHGATEADARRLGSALQTIGYFDGHQRASVVVSRSGTRLAACFVVADDAWNDSSIVQAYQDMRAELTIGPFADTPLEVRLCDVWLKPQVVIAKDGRDS